MKSLESLEIINICLKELDYEHKEDTNIWRYDLEVIKQDLEVLEIIRKKKVNVAIFMNFLKIEDNEKILEIYNYINYAQSKLTLEEIVKLKQWLEVNENDR